MNPKMYQTSASRKPARKNGRPTQVSYLVIVRLMIYGIEEQSIEGYRDCSYSSRPALLEGAYFLIRFTCVGRVCGGGHGS
jgi:hypothetical protein